MRVGLTPAELLRIGGVGVSRHVSAIKNDHQRQDGTIPSWDEDIEGAAAECAYAKLKGIYWSGSVNAFHEPDVGKVGVRWTHRENGCLILRARDFERYGDDAIFVLVTGGRGVYEVVGQITLGQARDAKFASNPHGWGSAYFVPGAALSVA